MPSLVSECLVIVAYKRADNLKEIIERALFANVGNIYISIDCAKTAQDSLEVEKVETVARHYSELYKGQVRFVKRKVNFGSSNNVRTSISEAMEFFEDVIVLEDDCIPAADFFKFCDVAFDYMSDNPQVVLSSGSQFVLEGDYFPVLSIYPLIWGWCINRVSWNRLQDAFRPQAVGDPLPSNLGRAERAFWRNGRRRSLNGYIDAWDIPLAAYMLSNNLLALHSPVNLVTNSGDDSVALHVRQNDPFCNRQTGEFLGLISAPVQIPTYDRWLRRKLFKIRIWHPVTGFIRKAIEFYLRPVDKRDNIHSPN